MLARDDPDRHAAGRFIADHDQVEIAAVDRAAELAHPAANAFARLQQGGAGRAVVEFGSGSSVKTPHLLRAVQGDHYVPIDISGDFLRDSAREIAAQFPVMAVEPVEGDFLKPLKLPAGIGGLARLGFFPGSTIGNLEPAEAVAFLTAARRQLGDGALFILGVDLVKAPETLIAAYDGFFGPGTGSFFVFLFVRWLGYDFLHASASAKLLNTTSNLAALMLFAWKGHVWWHFVLAMAVANVVGSLLGTRLALKHGSGFVRIVFIFVVSALILKTTYDAWLRG